MKPLILVTNDDGIIAPGIKALVEVMSTIGEVVVVAPDSPQSAKGHSITITDPIHIRKVKIFDGIEESYECSGTPADCVKIARKVILKNRKIDICVSGINHGSNASINVLYSGTMSAAMEGSLEGIKSIGFSLCDFSFEADFKPCLPYVKKITEGFLKLNQDTAKLLNVNFPKDEIKGMKICTQAKGNWIEDFQVGTNPRGENYYWMTGKFVNIDPSENADLNALKEGYISIVPVHHDLTHHEALHHNLLDDLIE